jgi:hypothetical protein
VCAEGIQEKVGRRECAFASAVRAIGKFSRCYSYGWVLVREHFSVKRNVSLHLSLVVCGPGGRREGNTQADWNAGNDVISLSCKGFRGK